MNEFIKVTDISDSLKEALESYVQTGELHGGFLTALLENDLREAICRADAANQRDLPYIVQYCMRHIPYQCWGSKQRVDNWINQGGLKGR